jgi:hypothetical protein
MGETERNALRSDMRHENENVAPTIPTDIILAYHAHLMGSPYSISAAGRIQAHEKLELFVDKIGRVGNLSSIFVVNKFTVQ